MTDYRTWLDKRGVQRGPWVVRERDAVREKSDPVRRTAIPLSGDNQ